MMDLIPISLFDSISIKETEGRGIGFSSNMDNVPQEDNLVVKAIRSLEKEAERKFSLNVRLEKRIPSGAGLGGGSGNAGGILTVLNKLYQLNISEERLKQLALEIGADVPFFINPKPSLAEGIGERLTDLQPFEPIHLLLLYPGFPISTGQAYSNCLISGRDQGIKSYAVNSFENLGPEINDFWPSLKNSYVQLVDCRQLLLNQGAIFCGMSGSGSTLFSIFEDQKSRDEALSRLHRKEHWKLFPCNTLNRYEFLA